MSGRLKNFWNRNGRNVIFLTLIVMTASVPLLTDYLLEGENLQNVLTRIELISQGLTKSFPVRIQPAALSDYGYGAAAFEADVFLIVPGVLHRMGLSLQAAYKLYLWAVNIATAVCSFLCFEKCFHRQDMGLVGSLLFTWCPYRLSSLYVVAQAGEAAAWCFLPLLLLGLVRLYAGEDKQKGVGRTWVLLTAALLLILSASMTVFVIAAGMCVLWLFLLGKRALSKDVRLTVGKTVLATGLLGAWFLIPLLYFVYKNTELLGNLILQDVRSGGLSWAVYLMTFFGAGTSENFWENGMAGTQSLGMGFAVTACVLFFLWSLFTGRYAQKEKKPLCKRLAVLGLVLAYLSTSSFPWELLQNKNLLFSLFLGWMQSPAKWGIGACAVFILLSCQTLYLEREEGWYRICLGITISTAFLTTQFLTGEILLSAQPLWLERTEEWAALPLQVITGIPWLWRVAEGISLSALAFLVFMAAKGRMRRGKSVEKV